MFDRDPLRLEPRADPFGVGAALSAEIALGGAVIDPKPRRIADATRRIGMAHQRDMTARAQGRPGGHVGVRDVRRGGKAEKEGDDGGTVGAWRRPSQR